MASIINATTTNGVAISADNSGILQIATNNGITAVNISTNQVVSLTNKLSLTSPNLGATTGVLSIADYSTNNSSGFIQWTNNAQNTQYADIQGLATGGLAFANGTNEVMRFNQNGTLLIGQTANPNASSLVVTVPTGTANGINTQITSNTGVSYPLSNYNASGSYSGGIVLTSGTTTSLAATSDSRLKNDLGVYTNTDIINKTVIHQFTWKSSGETDIGVFAQEYEEINPTAVFKGTDDLTEDGSLARPWSVDYLKFIPELIVYSQELNKTIQEQQALISTLQTQIITLNTKVGI